MVRFKIRDYPFGDLAQMYYPDHNYDSALRLFRREMHDTRGMWQAMQGASFYSNTITMVQNKKVNSIWEKGGISASVLEISRRFALSK